MNGLKVSCLISKSHRKSHFGGKLRAYILSQYFSQHVTQPLLLTHLQEIGVEISSGQLSRILNEEHESFHEEKAELLSTGLRVSGCVGVDDTSARHRGRNGVATRIGNEFFTWFSSTNSKSRINFLSLLCAGHISYTIDDVALHYMKQQKLPKSQSCLLRQQIFPQETSFRDFLSSKGITTKRHVRIITEGALLATIVSRGIFEKLVIISDDAGQFRITGILHALCWVHAERNIDKI